MQKPRYLDDSQEVMPHTPSDMTDIVPLDEEDGSKTNSITQV